MKRKNTSTLEYLEAKRFKINEDIGIMDDEFIDNCNEDFEKDPTNIISRNAVVSVGALNASIDSVQANKVSHVFLNSLKPNNLKATNQQSSGRCWMFAGLNIFRYLIIKGLNLDQFEFSETYLFFWDKFERSNTIIQWFIDNPDANPSDRVTDIMSNQFITDGGWWNYFSNLVKKYGLIPKEAMDETFHSGWSDEMNDILKDIFLACASHINRLQKQKNMTRERLMDVKNKTMKQIYNTLVKFLGNPPTTFDWFFANAKKETNVITDLTPQKFVTIGLASLNIDDFVVLANIPNKKRPFYQNYEIKNSSNVVGGERCKIINLPIYELKKYAAKSIIKGMPVWFSGDVRRGFHPYKSVLDEQIFNKEILFGKTIPFSKENKLEYKMVEGNHAMTLTGVNFDHKGSPVRWQVENSWGFVDNEEEGMNGFLSMSDKWFEDNLVQIVVHKNFLSRNIQNKLKQKPVELEIWDYVAPALRIKEFKN